MKIFRLQWVIAVTIFWSLSSSSVSADKFDCVPAFTILSRKPGHWTLEGGGEKSGTIHFMYLQDLERRLIWINNYFGIKNKKGAGSFLLQSVREAFPQIPIGGTMGATNREAVASSTKISPYDPDFSAVPFIRALKGSYHLNFRYVREPVDQRILMPFVDITVYPRSPSEEMLWLNRDEILNDSEYREMVETLYSGRPRRFQKLQRFF